MFEERKTKYFYILKMALPFGVILLLLLLSACGFFKGNLQIASNVVCPLISQKFTTVDNYNLSSGQDAYPFASSGFFETATRGTMIVTGIANDSSGNQNWIVRRSSNPLSGNWTTVDDFVLLAGNASQASGGTKSATTGNLFVAGWAADAIGLHGIVRKSTDGGTTWNTVDNLLNPYVNGVVYMGATSDPMGNVYACGYATNAGGTFAVMRKSTDQGNTWTTIQSYQYTAGQFSSAYACYAMPNGYLFLGGPANDSSNKSHWVVQRSMDGGTTWTVVDDLMGDPATGDDNAPDGFYATPNGTLFVTGYVTDSAGHYTWTTRSTNNYGASWTTSDSYQYSPGQFAVANPIFSDECGNIYAGGVANDSGGQNHAIVRRSLDGGNTWSTIDDYQLFPGSASRNWAGGIDSLGNIFFGAEEGDSGNVKHWIVRMY